MLRLWLDAFQPKSFSSAYYIHHSHTHIRYGMSLYCLWSSIVFEALCEQSSEFTCGDDNRQTCNGRYRESRLSASDDEKSILSFSPFFPSLQSISSLVSALSFHAVSPLHLKCIVWRLRTPVTKCQTFDWDRGVPFLSNSAIPGTCALQQCCGTFLSHLHSNAVTFWDVQTS